MTEWRRRAAQTNIRLQEILDDLGKDESNSYVKSKQVFYLFCDVKKNKKQI